VLIPVIRGIFIKIFSLKLSGHSFLKVNIYLKIESLIHDLKALFKINCSFTLISAMFYIADGNFETK